MIWPYPPAGPGVLNSGWCRAVRPRVHQAPMRAAWANFAASGNPASAAVPWPAFSTGSMPMLSLVPPRPRVETDFASRHHCAFWAAGS